MPFFDFQGNFLGEKLLKSLGREGVKEKLLTRDVIYGWYLMLWFAPNDAWDRPHEPIHIVNAFYDGPIGKLKEKCLVGIMKFIYSEKTTKISRFYWKLLRQNGDG